MTPTKAWIVSVLLWASQAHGFVWPSTIERVARDLGSEDLATRRRAVSSLQTLPVSAQRRLLPRALDDADVEVRAQAAAGAIRLRLQVADKVIPWLTDSNASLRRAAAEVLAASPDKNATSLLARVLGDPEAVVRAAAVRALAASRDPDAALALLGRVDDVDPRVRESVMEALGELRDPRTTVALMAKIRDPRASVRRGAVQVLGQLGDQRARSALIAALADSEAEVQIAALAAIPEFAADDVTAVIAPLARQLSRKEVAEAALLALGHIHSPEALAILIEVATSGSEELEPLARRAFSVAGETALPPLAQCLAGQPAMAIADGCVRALGYVSSARAGEIVLDALRRRITSPSAALLALARLNSENSLDTVLEYLASADQVVRQSAILATVAALDPKSQDGRAIDPIVKALDIARDNREERVQLLRLLGLTGSPRALVWLTPFVNFSGDVATRVAALDALGRIANSGQGALLVTALDDSAREARSAAALALRRLADSKTAAPLLLRIENGVAQDREALVLALGGALRGATDESILRRVSKLIRDSRGGERDAWIEAAGFIPGKRGSALLLDLVRSSVDLDDRAKVVEALAAHPEARAELLKLAATEHEGVRANAIWALTSVATPHDSEFLSAAVGDEDPAVAANAMAALARLAVRDPSIMSNLCAGLKSDNVYVRVNALGGLRLAKLRCPDASDERLLTSDSSPEVRRAAARLLAEVSVAKLDVDALAGCRDRDPDGSVALTCAEPAEPRSDQTASVTVFVIADGESQPTARAAFALRRGDGLVRLGRADRRGAVSEVNAPLGPLQLEVPISANIE